MLCLPAKTTSNKVDWASSLSKYVARAYSKAQAEAHKEQFRRVDELRRQVAAASEARLEERTAADARALYVRYYKLLCSMEQRFEVAELRLTFPWRDAFQSGMRQGEADLRFERAAVLFNVASAVTFEAASQNRRSAEGIRRACKLFQEAAGVLHAVAALVGEAAWGASASVDLAPRTLATLASLMLAQAQRCFYEKAEQDAMSPKLLSKIAAQVALLYAEVLSALRAPPLSKHMGSHDGSWAAICEANHKMFGALAQFHAAAEHASDYQYGHQVARLTHAAALLGDAAKITARASVSAAVKQVYADALARVSFAYEQAKKDNETVYCEPVPPFASLPAVGPRAIVKPTQLPDLDAPASPNPRDDPFVHIVPAGVQHQLARFKDAGKGVADDLCAKMLEAVGAGAERLSALDLPHALQAYEHGDEGKVRLPPDVKEAVGRVHAAGGDQALRVSIEGLEGLKTKCEDHIAEVRAALESEDDHDARLTAAHGETWRLILSSAAATEELKGELRVCEERLAAASGANVKVHTSYSDGKDGLAILEMPLDVLEGEIPHAAGSPIADLACTKELRARLSELDAHHQSRIEVVNDCHVLEGVGRRVRLTRALASPVRGAAVPPVAVGAGVTLSDRAEEGKRGVVVSRVDPGGLAAAAGVCEGEVLLTVGGKECSDHAQAIKLLDAAMPLIVKGQAIELLVENDGSALGEDSLALIHDLVYLPAGAPTDDLLARHLSRYDGVRAQAEAFVATSTALLDAIAKANEAFTQARISEGTSNVRQEYFKSLNKAVATYDKLASQVAEGVAFFNSAVARLSALHDKVGDLVAARLVEREDLQAQIESERAREEARRKDAAAAAAAEAAALAAATVFAPPPAFASVDVASAAAQPPPSSAAPNASSKQLMEMGFSREQAEGALEHAGGSMDAALTLLLSGEAPPPPPPAAGTPAPALAAAPSNTSSLSDKGTPRSQYEATPRPFIRQLSRQGTVSRFEVPTALPPKVQQLVDMGFTKEAAAAALAHTNGAVDEAAARLLSGPPAPAPVPAPAPAPPPPPPPAPAVTVAPAAAAPPQLAVLDGIFGGAGQHSESHSELVGMGFSSASAAEALRRANGVLADAVQILLDTPDLEPAPPPPPVTAPVPVAAPVATPVAAPVAAAPAPPSGAPSAAEVRQLVEMGFPAARAASALQQAGGDAAAALNLLLADADTPAPSAPPPQPPPVTAPPSFNSALNAPPPSAYGGGAPAPFAPPAVGAAPPAGYGAPPPGYVGGYGGAAVPPVAYAPPPVAYAPPPAAGGGMMGFAPPPTVAFVPPGAPGGAAAVPQRPPGVPFYVPPMD